MINDDTLIKIIDSVDLFLSDNKYLMTYYMNTRQRKSFRVNADMIHLLENIDGENSVGEIKKIMQAKYQVDSEDIDAALDMLKKNHIATENKRLSILDDEDAERYTRQINYFTEFLGEEEKGQLAQKKLFNAKVIILGCGAVGGDIAGELAMAGVRNLTLYDSDVVEASDVTRHIYYTDSSIGKKKTEALKEYIEAIDHKSHITTIDQYMHPKDEIEELIKAHNFVVNTLDEPYIGYTSSKISRICVKYRIPHFIAGGFDAHLASTGELIIPYVTPCVECYADYFKATLKDWKPKKHPVKIRYKEIGGLASMTLFSASYACIEIIKTIAGLVDMDESFKVRGELLFNDLSLTYLNVKKNPNCPVCGENSTL